MAMLCARSITIGLLSPAELFGPLLVLANLSSPETGGGQPVRIPAFCEGSRQFAFAPTRKVAHALSPVL